MGSILEPLFVFRARCPRDPNRNDQALHLPGWRSAHLFLNSRGRTREVKLKRSGDDAHGGQHARPE